MSKSDFCPLALSHGADYEHVPGERCIWCGKKDGVLCPRDKDWELLRDCINQLEQEKSDLTNQWNKLQSNCSHPRFPKRELGDEYCDICPDCGYMVYCYSF